MYSRKPAETAEVLYLLSRYRPKQRPGYDGGASSSDDDDRQVRIEETVSTLQAVLPGGGGTKRRSRGGLKHRSQKKVYRCGRCHSLGRHKIQARARGTRVV